MAACLTVLLAVARPVLGNPDEHEEEESATLHEEEHGHELHPNLLAFFLGVTAEERRESGFSLGLEYERRLKKSFGIGGLIEHTFGDLDFTVYAVSFAFHAGRWKLTVAPGVEDGEEGSEALVRLGAEYAFEAGSWEIAPQLDVDFVDGEEEYVLGLAFGKGF